MPCGRSVYGYPIGCSACPLLYVSDPIPMYSFPARTFAVRIHVLTWHPVWQISLVFVYANGNGGEIHKAAYSW